MAGEAAFHRARLLECGSVGPGRGTDSGWGLWREQSALSPRETLLGLDWDLPK